MAFHKYSMDINILRDKWQEFLATSISAKYGTANKDELAKQIEEFDKFWEEYKNEQSRNREGNPGETDQTRV